MAILNTYDARKFETKLSAEKLYELLTIFQKAVYPVYVAYVSKLNENLKTTNYTFKEIKSHPINLTEFYKSQTELETLGMNPDNKFINIGEFNNQMANLETLIAALEFAIRKYEQCTVITCSPASTTCDHELDSDLLLKTKEGHLLFFEVSDVLEYNNNDKLAKDLNTLFLKRQRVSDLGIYGSFYIFSRNTLFHEETGIYYLKTAEKSSNAKVYRPDTVKNSIWSQEVHLSKPIQVSESLGYKIEKFVQKASLKEVI